MASILDIDALDDLHGKSGGLDPVFHRQNRLIGPGFSCGDIHQGCGNPVDARNLAHMGERDVVMPLAKPAECHSHTHFEYLPLQRRIFESK